MRSALLFFSFSCTLLCLLMISCSGEPDPRDTGTEFLRSLKEGEFEKAGRHASASSSGEIHKLLNHPDADSLLGLPEDIVPGKFEQESEIRGTFYYLDGQEEKSIVLVKENGEWKVEVPNLLQMSPQTVAKRFLEAFKKQDYETAGIYSTETTKQQLELLQRMQADERLGQKEVRITIGDVTNPTPETAEVSYEDDGRRKTLKLMLVSEEWKVNWSKMDDATQEMEMDKSVLPPPPPPLEPDIEIEDKVEEEEDQEEVTDEIVGPDDEG